MPPICQIQRSARGESHIINLIESWLDPYAVLSTAMCSDPKKSCSASGCSSATQTANPIGGLHVKRASAPPSVSDQIANGAAIAAVCASQAGGGSYLHADPEAEARGGGGVPVERAQVGSHCRCTFKTWWSQPGWVLSRGARRCFSEYACMTISRPAG